MWKKFFEKPKTAIYRGAFGLGSNPNRKAICVPDKLGEKPTDVRLRNSHYCRADCADEREASPQKKNYLCHLYLLWRIARPHNRLMERLRVS